MKKPRLFGTYDFETYEWVNPLCGDLFNGHEHTYVVDRDSPVEVVRRLLSEMEASEIDDWWAHNGGKFDALFIVDCIKQLPGWKCDGATASGRIISLRIMSPHNCWTLKDSFAVIQASLDKALTSFDIPHKKVFTKADYDALDTDPRAMCKHSDEKLREGCQADTKGLWHLIDKARAMFEEWGGQLKSTFSASALTVVKAQFGKPLASHEGQQWANDIARRSYCGGRVEVFKHMPFGLHREYDVTSSYPWSMTQPLPWNLLGYGEPRIFDKDILSIVYAKVTVPKQYIPPLPYVPPTGGLFFPYGVWSGWFTSAELAYAIQHCGVTAVLHDAINYTVEQPFAAFVEKVFKVKQQSTGAVREFTKLILNGCYGKFAQKPETSKLRMFESASEAWEWAREHSNQQPKPINASNTAWEVKVRRWPKHTHYALASFVTAYSRILLHKHLTAAANNGDNRLLAYCDTDSVHCRQDSGRDYFNRILQEKADALGGLKLSADNFNPKYYAPKLYTLSPETGETLHIAPADPSKRQIVYKSKGFPVSAAAFARIVEGERVGNPKGRMQLVKTQLKKDNPVIHLTEEQTAKQWHGQSTKRFCIPFDPEGDTEPWSVKELHEGAHEKQASPIAPHRPAGPKTRRG
jgi:hypothetical protein